MPWGSLVSVHSIYKPLRGGTEFPGCHCRFAFYIADGWIPLGRAWRLCPYCICIVLVFRHLWGGQVLFWYRLFFCCSFCCNQVWRVEGFRLRNAVGDGAPLSRKKKKKALQGYSWRWRERGRDRCVCIVHSGYQWKWWTAFYQRVYPYIWSFYFMESWQVIFFLVALFDGRGIHISHPCWKTA